VRAAGSRLRRACPRDRGVAGRHPVGRHLPDPVLPVGRSIAWASPARSLTAQGGRPMSGTGPAFRRSPASRVTPVCGDVGGWRVTGRGRGDPPVRLGERGDFPR
jgi:hypothetical protein